MVYPTFFKFFQNTLVPAYFYLYELITILIYFVDYIMIKLIQECILPRTTEGIEYFVDKKEDQRTCWINSEESLKKDHGSWSL